MVCTVALVTPDFHQPEGRQEQGRTTKRGQGLRCRVRKYLHRGYDPHPAVTGCLDPQNTRDVAATSKVVTRSLRSQHVTEAAQRKFWESVTVYLTVHHGVSAGHISLIPKPPDFCRCAWPGKGPLQPAQARCRSSGDYSRPPRRCTEDPRRSFGRRNRAREARLDRRASFLSEWAEPPPQWSLRCGGRVPDHRLDRSSPATHRPASVSTDPQRFDGVSQRQSESWCAQSESRRSRWTTSCRRYSPRVSTDKGLLQAAIATICGSATVSRDLSQTHSIRGVANVGKKWVREWAQVALDRG